jgi:hypothetical protein
MAAFVDAHPVRASRNSFVGAAFVDAHPVRASRNSFVGEKCKIAV